MTVSAVITAAGLGTRLGSALPKALVVVAGRTLVAHALDRVAPLAARIVVTAPADHFDAFVGAVEGRADVVVGGTYQARLSVGWRGGAYCAGLGGR